MNDHYQQHFEIGMIGLGVMGRNFLLNIADHGFPVAGYDKDKEKVEALKQEAEGKDIGGFEDIGEFIDSLKKPRAVMMLVPAGAPIDSVIEDLTGHIEEGDLIIDAGNSYFKDTNLRSKKLEKKGIHFMGTGISGGEEGARRGPSIMPGGNKEAYERVRPVLEAAAAKVDDEPCVTYLGTGSAGHFVKMVHNGIEYAVMQLISESYNLMKTSLGLDDDKLHKIYTEWNRGELSGYLMEITGHIFAKTDEKTGTPLIDQILDVARQKGTGMWTSQSAMELHVPIPTIDLAVSMRDMSVYEKQRDKADEILNFDLPDIKDDSEMFIENLCKALYAGIIITYAQGMSLLIAASEKYNYHLDPEAIARIWRGGCIIRADLLEDIRKALKKNPELPNLLLDPGFSGKIKANQDSLRYVVSRGAETGIPVPAFMTSLGYLDAYRSGWLPANLIQAQRDYFGSHTYERIDAKGTFHTEWEKE